MGMEKQVRELVIRFLDTLGGKVGDGVDFDPIQFRDTTDPMDDSPPLFSGDKDMEFDGDHEREGTIILKQDLPLPMTVLAIFIKYRVTGR